MSDDIIVKHPMLVKLMKWIETRPAVGSFLVTLLVFLGLGLALGFLWLMYVLGGWFLMGFMAVFLVLWLNIWKQMS